MAITINYMNGTGWPPTAGMDTCVKAAIAQVLTWIDATFSLDLQLNYATGPAGTNHPKADNDTDYGTIRNTYLGAMATNKPNPINASAVGALPTSSGGNNGNPIPVTTYSLLSLFFAIHTNTDDLNVGTPPLGSRESITIGNNSGTGIFDTTIGGQTCDPSKISLWGITQHEVTELMGRNSIMTAKVRPVDLIDFTGVGAFSQTGTTGTRYASIDNGVTNIGSYPNSIDYCDFGPNPTGTGYYNPTTSIHSPYPNTYTLGEACSARYEDVQIMGAFLPLSPTGLLAAGLPTTDNGGSAPTITGPSGGTLTANSGTWFGYGTITKGVWQWNRNGVPIGGATASTFNSAGETVGTQITVTETASGFVGTNTATSAVFTITGSGGGGRRFRLDLPLSVIPAVAVAPIIIRNPAVTRRGLILPRRR